MKKRLFLLFITMLFLRINAVAQYPVEYPINIEGLNPPALIFSEFRVDVAGKMYIELANVGSEDIDLSDFTVISCQNYSGFATVTEDVFTLRNATFLRLPLSGNLSAGDSYVITSVYDNLLDNGVVDPNGYPMHNIGMLDVADHLMHQLERTATQFLNKPEWQAYAFDSISTHYMYDVDLFNGFMLQYRYQNGEELDSTLLDLANIYRSEPTFQGKEPKAIAGRADAVNSYIMVRKATITQGNMDWDNSIGTDADDSEWMTIPVFKSKYNVFSTIGTHGNFDLDYSSNRDDIIIDKDNKILTLPWEIVRGEDIIDNFTFGSGMAWNYVPNGDQTFSTVQNGDQLSFYAAGNVLKQVDLTIEVSDPTAKIAVAYSRRHRVESLRDQGAVQVSYPELYQIFQGASPSAVGYINGVEFATRVDTLLANLIIPDNALFEFTFVDGQERVDLKQGDKLVVYSEDFSVQKEYIINIDAYAASDNANLSNILWPDIDLNVYGEIWDDISLPGFTPNNKTYFVLLASEEMTIPALQYKTEDINARIEVVRASDPDGTIGQRTTKVTVTSEDGLQSNVYDIIFEKVSVPVQPFKAEPFMSEIGGALQSASVVEIYNPGTEPIDLRNYMIVRGASGDNLKTAVEHLWLPEFGHPISYWIHSRYRTHYVPGMKWQGDTRQDWQDKPGYLEPEFTTSTTIVQPGQVFAIGSLQDGGWIGGRFEDRIMHGLVDNLDICLRGWSEQVPGTALEDSLNMPYNLNPNGDVLRRDEYPTQMMFGTGVHGPNSNSIFLLRIDNDSIIEGSIPVTNPHDYTIIDRFQKPTGAEVFMVGGIEVGPIKVLRLPHVYKGVTEAGEGIGDDNGNSPNNAGWTVLTEESQRDPNYPPDVYGYNISGALRFGETVGWHITDRYTGYLSIINSLVYDVTPGNADDLFIRGDFSGATVSSVIPNIIKSHEGQAFKFFHNGTVLDNEDAIVAGDSLQVTSFDSINQSTYIFETASLSSDNVLTAISGSGLTISDFSISGFEPGVFLRDIMRNLIAPETARLNVLGANENLVPFTYSSHYDSIINVTVSPDLLIEVIAENGDIARYNFDFGFTSSDAILFSNYYVVNQENKSVSGVPYSIAVEAFLSSVYTNEGATIKIFDKADFDRIEGKISPDDKVVVTSQDGTFSLTYTLSFAPDTSTTIIDTTGTNIVRMTKPGSQVTLYPNPATDIIQFNGIEARSVSVYTISGHLVIRKNLSSNELDVSLLDEGLYIIGIADSEGSYRMSKFIKQ